MKTRFSLLLLSLTALSLLWTACDNLGINGTGSVVSQHRYLRDFSSIKVTTSGNVHIRQDTAFGVTVASNQNILDVLKTEVKNGELVISFEEDVRKYSSLDIYVSLPEIKQVSATGSAMIDAENDLTVNAATFSVSGSGNIALKKITANVLTTRISGSGSFSAANGVIEKEDLHVSGSGNIDMSNAPAETSSATITGSGDILLHVKRALTANISGSGSIRYRGAATVNTSISGSGSVKQM